MIIIIIIKYKNIKSAFKFIYKSKTKTIDFPRSASLKVNPKFSFTQYNWPNTHRSTYLFIME